MAKTKQQLIVENNTQFPNNNTGFISPDKLRTFNVDMIDSMVDELSYGVYTASIAAESASFDARIDALEGLSGSISSSIGAISASVASVSASVLILNDYTSSANQQLAALEIFTGSLNGFTASVEAQFAVYDEEIYNLNVHSQSLNAYTASVNSKFSTLATTTASLQTQINTLASATSSYAVSASVAAVDAAQQSQIDQLTAFTGSVGVAATGSLFASASFTDDTITFTKGNGTTQELSGFVDTGSFGAFTSSVDTILGELNSFTSSADGRLDNIESTTASLNTSVSNLNSTTASLNTSVGALNSFTQSQTSFNTSATASIEQLLSFSSSLDSGYVTEAELAAATGALQNQINTKLDTASFNAYTSSTDGRLTNIEATTASLNTSVTNLNSFTASQQALNTTFATTGSNTFTDNQFINTGSGLYTNRVQINTLGANLEIIPGVGQDVIVKGGDLVVEGTFTSSLQEGYLYVGNSAGTLQAVPTSSIVTQINTGSLATTGSNYFVGNQLISGSVSVTGSIFLRSGSLSGSVISNLTDTYTSVPAVDYIVTLTSASYAGLVSGSLTNPNTMYVVSDIGYTPISTFNSFTASVNTKFDNVQASTASLNTFTSSAAVRLTNLESTTASLNTSVTNLNSFTASANTKFDNISISTASLNAFTASAAGRLTNIEATTASLNTSVTNLNSFTASQTTLNGTFATTGSNVFRGTETISGSLNVSGSSTFGGGDTNFTDQNHNINIDVDGVVIKGQKAVLVSQSLDVQSTFTASLQQGYVWVGNSAGRTTTVATSSFGGGSTDTGSLLVTASAVASTITFTKGDATTFDVTVSGGTGTGFPFTGSAQISGSLGITGSISFVGENFYVSGSKSGSFISNITDTYTSSTPIKYITTLDSASYAALATGSTFAPDTLYVVSGALEIPSVTNGNIVISGSLTITGSAYGNVNTLSVTSNTASMDMRAANFFVLTLPTGSTTHLDATNVGLGQTVSLLVKQATTATGSLVFSPEFKFPTGSRYTASTTGSAEDIITFVTFNTTGSVYATSVKQLV